MEYDEFICNIVCVFRTYEEITKRKEMPIFDPERIMKFSPATSPSLKYDNRKRCVPIVVKFQHKTEPWSLECIAKAGKLLRKPPLPVEFANEHEMRKVYSLIYDVFRCEYINY